MRCHVLQHAFSDWMTPVSVLRVELARDLRIEQVAMRPGWHLLALRMWR